MSKIKPIGYCRFCGNSRIVEISEEESKVYDQTALDTMAADQCTCEGACHFRKMAADFETTSSYIDNLVDKEDLAEALKGFIKPLQDFKAMSISVKIDDKTKFSMSVGQDGALSVQRVDTLKTQYDTE